MLCLGFERGALRWVGANGSTELCWPPKSTNFSLLDVSVCLSIHPYLIIPFSVYCAILFATRNVR